MGAHWGEELAPSCTLLARQERPSALCLPDDLGVLCEPAGRRYANPEQALLMGFKVCVGIPQCSNQIGASDAEEGCWGASDPGSMAPFLPL